MSVRPAAPCCPWNHRELSRLNPVARRALPIPDSGAALSLRVLQMRRTLLTLGGISSYCLRCSEQGATQSLAIRAAIARQSRIRSPSAMPELYWHDTPKPRHPWLRMFDGARQFGVARDELLAPCDFYPA